MSEFSDHTKWQASHYDENPPLNPWEKLLREVGFSKTVRPKDLATRQYLDKLALNEHTSILDMGCASGLLLQRIRISYKSRGTGIDVSAVLINKAQQEDPKNTYLMADASHLPFPENTFDLITSFDNLEHIKEYREVIKEMVRVLKPGGKILLNTINKHNKFTFDWALEKLGSDYHLKRAGHVKELFFDPKEIENLFIEAGLKNTEIHLFDATIVLIVDCALYIFLMIVEKVTPPAHYHSVGLIALSTTHFISLITLPICEKIDTIITRYGYSNAFFLTGEKV
ncbi:MAG: class I SAM-dependent methyltransferase [bacterium]|nr:class I SAM-dependent methyltransferase [bacterium]